ncbi:alpha/beta hydrolase [Bengtsoniella intestinalis]|uniref:alpha/beta fold hydrolase n=1 Tax=Bengtsoniella intestinalis TaxID=3073143 RepID=UPI00391F3D32
MPYFVTDDRCKLYYEEKGQGEPLIFVHGWTCSRRYFKNQVAVFAQKYRVITYDLRGHGDSDRSDITETGMSLDRFAMDLKELMDYLNIKTANICGWSMGTSILLNFVQLYGCDRLKSLCFIDMTPKLLNDDTWDLGQGRNLDMAGNLGFMDVLATNWPLACELFIPNLFHAGVDTSSELFQWCMGQALSNTPHCMLNMWIAMAVKDYRAVLPTISVPVFLAYSGDGTIYFPAHGEYMQANIPTTTLDIFPGCGHGLFMENPEKFNADYGAFLAAL